MPRRELDPPCLHEDTDTTPTSNKFAAPEHRHASFDFAQGPAHEENPHSRCYRHRHCMITCVDGDVRAVDERREEERVPYVGWVSNGYYREVEYNPPLYQEADCIERRGQKREWPPTPTSGFGASFPALPPFGPWDGSAAAALASPSTSAPVFTLPHRPADSTNMAKGRERRGKMIRKDSAEDLRLDGRVDCMVLDWEGDEMPKPTYEEPEADREPDVEIREEDEDDEIQSTVSTGGSWYELDNEDCLLAKERGNWEEQQEWSEW